MAKLVMQLIEEEIPKRIAIHTPLKGYRLMYYFNKYLESRFLKVKDSTQISMYKDTESDSYFEVFKWEDELLDFKWICIANKLVVEKASLGSIFDSMSFVSYWDKKQKKVDFILEIYDSQLADISDILLKLENIPNISYAQEINKPKTNKEVC